MRVSLFVFLTIGLVACDKPSSIDTATIDRAIDATKKGKWREQCLALSPNPTQMDRLLCVVDHPWSVSRNKDPITDVESVIADTSTTRGIAQHPVMWESEPRLFLRCKGGSLDVFITWSEYFGKDLIKTTYRLDKSTPVDALWSTSTEKTATFMPEKEIPPFIDALPGKTDLAVRVTKSSGTEVTAEIKVNDSAGAIDAKDGVRSCNIASGLTWRSKGRDGSYALVDTLN